MTLEGFTYNGIHSEEQGVQYIPSHKDLWEQSADYDVSSVKVNSRPGGYYYQSDVKERTFTLSCFFEDITLETREKIRHWIGRNTSGRLIFDDRPFMYYDVRPTRVDTGNLYFKGISGSTEELLSGTFTITFTAFEPFGKQLYKAYKDYDSDNAGAYCGILEEQQMPPAPTASSTSFIVYNCGTEDANTLIRIGGTAANGLTITNYTNGTKCVLTSLPPSDYIEIDSSKGTVKYAGNLEYSYHSDGFIKLASYLPDIKNVVVRYSSGSNTITVSGAIPEASWIGKYVYQNGSWIKILYVNTTTGIITLQSSMGSTGIETTRIVTMNEIGITGDGVSLTTFSLDYTPLID